MKKGLVIAEKPSVSKEMELAYKKLIDYPYVLDFASCRGHLVALCQPDEYSTEWATPWHEEVLPMIPESWKTNVISNSSTAFNHIKQLILSNDYDFLINACDAGREGELIFYNVYEKIGKSIPVMRFWADDTTEKTIMRELQNLHPDSDFLNLRYAAKLRSYSDWLTGMNFSRMARLKTSAPINIGRVMTPTLNMVVQRKKEIENFVQEDYYILNALFHFQNMEFDGSYCMKNEDNYPTYRFKTEDEANNIKNNLPSSSSVVDILSKQTKSYAPQLYNISELQRDSNKFFGYSPDKSLSIAQSLYEKHYLSYPRTDSRYLSDNIADEIPERLQSLLSVTVLSTYAKSIIEDKKCIESVTKNKRYVDNTKLTDHHAIIPTSIAADFSKLSKDEINVYVMVCKRFLSIFLPPNIYNSTTLILQCGQYLFKSSGKETIQDGWMQLYEKKQTDKKLPTAKINDNVHFLGSKVLKKQTTPPSPYNYATLLSAMETAGNSIADSELKNTLTKTHGLGTGATRSEIIKKLLAYQYIEVKKDKKVEKILPTALGIKIIELLDGYDITSPILTAQWELKLNQVENGECSSKKFYKEMIEYVRNTTEQLRSLCKIEENINIQSQIISKCPFCSNNVKEGKNAYYCLGFIKDKNGNRNCNFAINKSICNSKITKNDVIDLISKGKTKKKTFRSKNGEFQRTLILNKDNPSSPIEFEKNDIKKICSCPKCGSDFIETAKYFRCVKYKDSCDVIYSKKYGELNLKPEFFEQLFKGNQIAEGNFRIHCDKNFRIRSITEILCQCPSCKEDVLNSGNYYRCRNYKNGCSFIISKTISGAEITPEDAVLLINGKKVSKYFHWKNGNSSSADIYINQENELKFDFPVKK